MSRTHSPIRESVKMENQKLEGIDIAERKIVVEKILLEFMLLPQNKGMRYVQYAILGAYDFYCNAPLANEIYPNVARRFEVRPQTVEVVIRKTIESAWKETPISIKEKYFGISWAGSKLKPTNGEFIAGIVAWMKREG